MCACCENHTHIWSLVDLVELLLTAVGLGLGAWEQAGTGRPSPASSSRLSAHNAFKSMLTRSLGDGKAWPHLTSKETESQVICPSQGARIQPQSRYLQTSSSENFRSWRDRGLPLGPKCICRKESVCPRKGDPLLLCGAGLSQTPEAMPLPRPWLPTCSEARVELPY